MIKEYAKVFGLLVINVVFGWTLMSTLDSAIVPWKCNTDQENIRIWSKADLSLIGIYSRQLTTSVYYWIYSIEVYLYKRGITAGVYELILNWNEECNVDEGTMISRGIEDAHTKFLQDIDCTRKSYDGVINEETKPRFNYDDEFDYHVLAKTLQYNDYIDPHTLITRLDAMVAGLEV